VSARPAGMALSLLLLSAVPARAGGSAPLPMQLLPLPQVMPRPVPAPMPPPTSPSAPPTPSSSISPLLLEPAPVWAFPSNNPPPAPPLPPAPIDQQKISSYRTWLEGQERMLQRAGGNPDALLRQQIQQQLLQLEQSGASR
jgi:hypothetical protein